MKKVIILLNSILILTIVLIISSCAKEDVAAPSTDNRARFLGTWGVNETSQKAYYDVKIDADPNASDRVLIQNFGNLGNDKRATAFISGSAITLDENQTISSWLLNGGGNINGSTTMIWSYTMDNGATTITANATFTKK